MIKKQLIPEGKEFQLGSFDIKDYLDSPINLGFITLIVCDQGSATISSNFKKYNLGGGAIMILFGEVNFIPLNVSENCRMSVYSISENIADLLSYKEHHNLFNFLYKKPIIQLTKEQLKQLKNWQSLVEYYKNLDNDIVNRLLINAFEGFFIIMEIELKKRYDISIVEHSDQKFNATANKLVKLVVKHIRENRNLNFFADQLNVTPGYLHKVMRKEYNRSPKDFIDCFAVSEIKSLLTTTSLSIKQIADEMNFNDPSYLSKFFTKQTGLTMTRFRSNYQKKIN